MSLAYLNHGALASDAIVSIGGLAVLIDLGSTATSGAPPAVPPFTEPTIIVSFSGGTMGHRKSKRPEEYARYTHHQPDVARPLLRYDLDIAEPGHSAGDEVPVLVNPATGKEEAPPRTFWIPSGTPDNPIAEEEFVFAVGDNQQRIWVPKRHGEVGRWRTVLVAPYGSFDIEWMAENAPTAFGQSLNPAQFWQEYQNTAAHNQQNPSQGGPSLREFQTPPVPAAEELKVPPSFTIHTAQGASHVEGATIPGHFSDFGKGQNSSHNMDATHSSFFWRHIGFEKLDLNIIAGRPLIHRITHLCYSPKEWDADEFDFPPNPSLLVGTPQRFRAIISQGPTIQDELGFDEGWYGDLYNDTALKTLDGVLAPTFDLSARQTWQVEVGRTVYDKPSDLSKHAIGPTLFPSGVGVFVHARSSDGFAIGYAAKIFPTGANKITVLQMINGESGNRVDGVPLPHHSHAGGKFLYVIMAFDKVRPAGWLGNFAYVYTGPLSMVLSELRKIRGQLGEQPDARKILPWNVREGTDIADVHTPIKTSRTAGRTMSARLT